MPVSSNSLELSLGLATSLAQQMSTGSNSSFHPLYDETVKKASELAMHFERDADLSHLLEGYRPYELKAVHDYRLEISEQVLWSYSQKMIGLITSTIFHPQNYHITYPDPLPGLEEDEQIKFLFEKDFPYYGNFETFMSQCLTREALVDANAWVIVWPETPDYAGISADAFRRYKPEVIPSENVLAYGRNFLQVLSTEEVPLQNGQSGYVFFTFVDGGIIETRQTGYDKKNKPTFDQFIYYENDTLKFRDFVFQIGGILAAKGRSVLSGYPQRFYLSPLEPCVPIFNDAARQYSDLQAAIVSHLHPQKYEKAIDCPSCGGTGEEEVLIGGEYRNIKCTANGCMGGKIHSGTSPLVSYIVEGDDKGQIYAPAGYIQQDIAVINAMIGHFFTLVKEGARVVNMDMLFEKEGNAQETARAKEIDREQLHILFNQVASVVFPLAQKVADAMVKLYFSGSAYSAKTIEDQKIFIKRPSSFDTTSISDALERIRTAKDSGIHHGVLEILTTEAIVKLFGVDTKETAKATALLKLDPSAFYSIDEMLSLNMMGGGEVFSSEDILLKGKLLTKFRQLTEKDPAFLDLPTEEQLAKLMEELRAGRGENSPPAQV